MIEVERKFRLTEDNKGRLIEGAEFVKEKVFTDIYYDTPDYALTSNDKWLRQRGGAWEFKISRNGEKNATDQYEELETEAEIREALELPMDGEMEEVIATAGYSPFCICTTTRRVYQNGDFRIDIDSVTYPDWDGAHQMAEIELMVPDESEMGKAGERIDTFAKELGLDFAPVRGKVIEYLKNAKPAHYQALWDCGLLARKNAAY